MPGSKVANIDPQEVCRRLNETLRDLVGTDGTNRTDLARNFQRILDDEARQAAVTTTGQQPVDDKALRAELGRLLVDRVIDRLNTSGLRESIMHVPTPVSSGVGETASSAPNVGEFLPIKERC